MPRGVRKVVEPVESDDEQKPADGTETMVVMKLLRNYRPIAGYEIVGDAPVPAYPGVGFPHKLWEGTIVRLPEAEAKALNKAGIAAREFD